MNITCISDTHGNHKKLDLNKGDILIHSGDFTSKYTSLEDFLIWFSKQDFKYKIFIAGNHDIELDKLGYDKVFEISKKHGVIYLEDTSVEIEGNLIYGSPWSCEFGGWSFMKKDHDLLYIWQKIPLNTNILITHGPAYKSGDKVNMGMHTKNVGSTTLKNRINNLSHLKAHIYGHIHGATGFYKEDGYISINASSSYEWYEKRKGEVKIPLEFKID